MQQINYIKHLNAVFQLFAKDSRLNPTHISLYIALFQMWNMNRYPKTFMIDRSEMMALSKIGSKTTYHRCISDLHDWKYLIYHPSHNVFKGSRIRMANFGTSDGQAMDKQWTSDGQALVSYTNISKHNLNIIKHKLPKNKIEVLRFFKKQNWGSLEAEKFYNHYAAIGWKIGGKIPIVDWFATAKNWMLKADEIKKAKSGAGQSQKRDNLQITKDKDYGQPL